MLHNTRKARASATLGARLCVAAALALVMTSQINVRGQSTPNIALKGTFASSVTDGVDLFSGKLEQVFPLLKVQGRGDTTQGLFLPLRNAEWRVQELWASTNNDRTYYHYQAVQGNVVHNFARAGYTTLGKLEVLTAFTGWNFWETPSVTTVKFTTNGGSIVEFRDVLTNGEPYPSRARGCVMSGYQTPNPPPECSRGKVFRATDGSNALFVADADIYDMLFWDMFGNPVPSSAQDNISGTIIMSDGTRISVGGAYNNITRITDRNGNFITIDYITESNYTLNFLSKIKDSLNREITIVYGDTAQQSYYDEIVYKGFGGAERRIRINYAPVETAMLPGHSLGVPLFPGVHTRCYMLSGGEPCDPTPAGGTTGAHYATSLVVPTSIALPNSTEYRFYYNKYLEVARVKYPTGSYVDYDYTGVTGAAADGFMEPQYAGGGSIYRRIGSARHFAEDGQLVSEKTFSNIPEIYGGTTPTIVDNVTIDVKDSAGTVVAKSRHYFYDFPGLEGLTPYVPMTFAKEHKTEILHPVTSAVLRKTEVTWKQREPFQWCQGGFFVFYACDVSTVPDAGPANDPRVTEIKTTLETGQVTTKTFAYDQYNNVTDTYEYDYGVGQPGPLLRRVHTDYETDPNYTARTGAHLLRMPLNAWVSSDADGNNKTAYTRYEYDNYASDAHHAPLVPRGGVSGHDGNYHAGHTRRGNPTSVTKFANAQNQTGALTSHAQFDVLGNIVKSIDPRGGVVTFDYSDHFGAPNGEARGNWDTVSPPAALSGLSTFAYATVTTNALGASYTQVDYSSGLVVDAEDVNGNVTTSLYADALDRRTQVIAANNRPALRNQQTVVYDDIGRKVTTTSDLFAFGDNLAKSEGLYDSLGRTTETRRFEAGGYVASKVEYDALGRAVNSSNPFRPHLNESPAWTATEYDALGRVKTMRAADNSEAHKDYNGNVTTVTDQAGKLRRSVVNALGQLVRLDEPNNQNDLGTLENPAQATSYLHNANGELVRVTQGQQSRFFLYDSVGRLVRVRQPEQETNPGLDLGDPLTGNSHWSAASTYDGNGNILTSTDTRGTVVTNTYDALDRLLTSTYSDGTPTVTNTYDDPAVPFSKGQLTKVHSSVSTTEYTNFDAAGRVLAHRQTTGGQVYTTARVYNLSGAVAEETYPSGRVVKSAYDNDDRLAEVSSRPAGQAAFQTYANGFAYTAAGALSQMRLGNGRWESVQFNVRLQITHIRLGSAANAGDLWEAQYDYGELDGYGNPQADKNNGNIARQTVSFAGLSQPFVQSYRYDPLNRLTEAAEASGGTQTWRQTFAYDRYGNRTSASQERLGAPTVTQTPSVDPASNRFTAGQGFAYDPNGNLTWDNLGRRFVFNGENKQVEVRDSANNVIGWYYYDGSGQRVKKVTAAETTVYVYGAGGDLLAEYSTLQGGGGTSYLTTDNLGSPRVITDAAGEVVARRDFMTFGEELNAGTAGRSAGHKYGGGADHVRQRFTGYEKDSETGLDFAEARYYDNRHGRFTAVDPLLASGMSADPQSFNRYAYVMNNPLTTTDPTGMFGDRDWYTVGPGDFFMSYDDGPSIKMPILYVEIIRRVTTTTTEINVFQRGGGQVVVEARVVITEVLVELLNDRWQVTESRYVETSAVAKNINDRPKLYTEAQLRTMETVSVAIVEVSRQKGFDVAIALGIARIETGMGTLPATGAQPSDTNPMQLTSNSGSPMKPKAGELRWNVEGAIDAYNRKRGSTENEKLQNYNGENKVVNGEVRKVAYARVAQEYIAAIRASRANPKVLVNRNWQMRDYRPVRVGPNPVPRTPRR